MRTVTVGIRGTKTYPGPGIAVLQIVRVAPFVAVLEICQRRTKTSRLQVSRYAVAEVTEMGTGIRTFRLTKPGGKEHYLVELPADRRQPVRCSCDGHQAGGWCKHEDAMARHWRAGNLVGLLPHGPHLPPSGQLA